MLAFNRIGYTVHQKCLKISVYLSTKVPTNTPGGRLDEGTPQTSKKVPKYEKNPLERKCCFVWLTNIN